MPIMIMDPQVEIGAGQDPPAGLSFIIFTFLSVSAFDNLYRLFECHVLGSFNAKDVPQGGGSILTKV